MPESSHDNAASPKASADDAPLSAAELEQTKVSGSVGAAFVQAGPQFQPGGGCWRVDAQGRRWLQPSPPPGEALRLQELYAYGVLDADADSELSELVQLTSDLFGMPMATVTLLDSKRQWFKSHIGMEVEKTSRDVAFCAHALSLPPDQLLVVSDTLADERFAGNPLVTGAPHLRFYAGAPLRTPEGHVLGTLCVMDREPRQFDEKQCRMLLTLARQVMTRLQLLRQMREQAATHRALLAAVDERQAAETARQLSEQRWRFALHGSSLGVWDANLQTHEVFYSDQWCFMLGLEPSEVGTKLDEWSSRVHPDDRARAQEMVRQHVEGKLPIYECEHRLLAKDGTWRRILARGKVMVWDARGKPLRMVGTHLDMTGLREAESREEKTRLLLAEAQQAAGMGTFEHDLVVGHLYWSEGACAIFGMDPEVFQNSFQTFINLVVEEDREVITKGLQRAEKEAGFIELEYRICRPCDGEVRWVYARGQMLFDEQGLQVRRIGVVMDITERKQAEATRKRQEMLLRAAGQTAKIGGWSVPLPDGRLECTPELAAMYDEEASFAPTVGEALSYFVPEHREQLRQAFERCAKDGTPYLVDAQIITRAGRRVWLRNMGEAVRDAQTGVITRVQGAVQDISAQREMEENLAESQRRFRLLADAMPFIVWTATPEGIVDFCNRLFYDYTGVSSESDISEHWQPTLHPEDLPRCFESWLASVHEEKPYIIEYRVLGKDGAYRWFRVQALPVWDAQGQLVKWYGAGIDIHDTKRLELEARQLASRLTTTLESLTDAFFTIDRDWRFTYLNSEAEMLVNMRREELVGQVIWELYPVSRGSIFEREYRRAMEQRVTTVFEGQSKMLNKWLEVHAYPSEEGLAVYVRDITEKKRREQHLNILSQLGQRLHAAESPTQAGCIITEVAAELFGWQAAALHLHSRESGLITPVLVIDTVDGTPTQLPLPVEPCQPTELERRVLEHGAELRVCSLAVAQKEAARAATGPVRLNSSTRSLNSEAPASETAPVAFCKGDTPAAQMLVPIRDGPDSIGLLSLWSQDPQAYSHADMHLLQLLADYCGGALRRIQADHQRRATEERFRLLAKATNDAVWDWDLPSNRLWWNDGFATRFGFDPGAAGPGIEAWQSRIHPDDRQVVLDSLRQVIASNEASWDAEYRYRCQDESYAYVLHRGSVMRSPDGAAVRMVGGMTDLTERRQTEEKIRQQAALLDKAQEAILVRDMEHQILFWNKSAERVYGWTAEEVCGGHVSELLYRNQEEFLKATAHTLKHGEWSGEIEQIRRDGSSITVEGHWSLVRDEEGKPKQILAINTDVTQRKRMEQQYFRAQRMESIGTLAGGIAHDLNNVLAPILMAIDLLKLGETDARRQGVLATIETSAKRGADMVRQVLSFARGVEGQQVEVELTTILHDIHKIADETFLKNIEVRGHIPQDLWLVKGDPTQLHQVLLNLCVNARDAMPSGGVLTLSAENVLLDEHYAGMNKEAEPGPHVCLSVTDTGCGMTPEVLERIFEPFFTTKDFGKGTGLGLSTTLAIIKSHGGFTQVESTPGKGTRFRVYIPALADVAAEGGSGTASNPGAPGSAPAAELPRGNGELVLVVDDEAPVRDITRQTLEAHGYRVLLACDGADGTALYASHRKEIAAVVTDMMMPVLDGPAMIKVLKHMDPSLPIIGASGLNLNTLVTQAMNAGVNQFIPKPFTAEALLKTLHQLITEKKEKQTQAAQAPGTREAGATVWGGVLSA